LATATDSPTSHIFFSQRLRLHYVDWGNTAAPPLILLHGGRDHCRNWDWVARALRPKWHIIAPDLRGHGDSQWSLDDAYGSANMVYDLDQLIHQQKLAPVSIIAHSWGAAISLEYAGIFPENVSKLVAIEGLGLGRTADRSRDIAERLRQWVSDERELSGRMPRRYRSLEDAIARMQEANGHLSPEQARYLTQHGVYQNEDGTYSWKFDNYVRSHAPIRLTREEVYAMRGRITCPVLLVHGQESWAVNPDEVGITKQFRDARVASFEGAGHWVHHDQLEKFLACVQDFL
jgi:pimeloyl-ACP methyl ester carboxylesterase